MFGFFKKRRLAKRLASVGAAVVTQYLVEVNNEPQRAFDTKKELLAFLSSYRSENQIFSLKLFRIEIYSL